MYITLKRFSEMYSWPSIDVLRIIYLQSRKGQNEFGPAFTKIGKRVHIEPETLFAIIETYGKLRKVT